MNPFEQETIEGHEFDEVHAQEHDSTSASSGSAKLAHAAKSYESTQHHAFTYPVDLKSRVDELERQMIEQALGLTYHQLRACLRKYDINVKQMIVS